MSADLAGIRRDLEGRLAALSARVASIEHAKREPLAADFSDQATDLEDGDSLEGVERSSLAEIAATRAAIARIDDGSYGVCVTCGRDIAPARLKVQPDATQCVACAGSR